MSAKNFQETHECSKHHNKDVGFHQLLLKIIYYTYFIGDLRQKFYNLVKSFPLCHLLCKDNMSCIVRREPTCTFSTTWFYFTKKMLYLTGTQCLSIKEFYNIACHRSSSNRNAGIVLSKSSLIGNSKQKVQENRK